jgi:GTP-binding protein
VSAITGEGLDALKEVLARETLEARREIPLSIGYVRHVVRDDPIVVERENGAWRVRARRAERAVQTTDMDSHEAVSWLQRRLIGMGVERALERAGARTGDEVRIGDMRFDYESEPPRS